MFTRTNKGLSNLRLFKGVDLVVFTEDGGGFSVPFEEALSGKHYNQAIDIEFWRNIFSLFRPDLTFSFRALGTKIHLGRSLPVFPLEPFLVFAL